MMVQCKSADPQGRADYQQLQIGFWWQPSLLTSGWLSVVSIPRGSDLNFIVLDLGQALEASCHSAFPVVSICTSNKLSALQLWYCWGVLLLSWAEKMSQTWSTQENDWGLCLSLHVHEHVCAFLVLLWQPPSTLFYSSTAIILKWILPFLQLLLFSHNFSAIFWSSLAWTSPPPLHPRLPSPPSLSQTFWPGDLGEECFPYLLLLLQWSPQPHVPGPPT